MNPTIKQNGTSHQLLRVACLEPLTTRELIARAERRVCLEPQLGSIQNRVRALSEHGFLRRTAPKGSQRAYILTRQGEEMLDALEAM